jgi:hypothetical protein
MIELTDLFIRPDFDNARIMVSFTNPGCSDLEYRILFCDSVLAVNRLTVDPGTSEVVFTHNIPGFKPWTCDDPALYVLELTFCVKGKKQVISQPFGMTRIHVADRVLYFNDEPIFIRGFIRGREAHDHPNLMGCSETEYYEKNIRMAKACGFNFVRWHSTVPSNAFLDAADRLGFLCQVEIRPYYGKYQKERELKGFDSDTTLVTESAWQQMLFKLRNHPCVLIYCMGNEIDKPGRNDRVKAIRRLTRRIDPTRLFLDTCSRGEYDRDTVDIDVQHMSYFAPFGKHYNMFDDSIHLSIYGSVTDKKMVTTDSEEDPTYMTRREIPLKFSLLAHEVCHYNVLRDPWKLREKFKKFNQPEPWWIEELIKMIKAKGHEQQFPQMLAASTRFQYIWVKQCLESVRKSPLLQGFQMLQFTDTDRYENANGLVDCFDDFKDIKPESIMPFNGPMVIVADLPKRSFHESSKCEIPIFVSYYSHRPCLNAAFKWTLTEKDSNKIIFNGQLDQVDLRSGLQKICRIELNLPASDKPLSMTFACELVDGNGVSITCNDWNLWLFPDRPDEISAVSSQIELKTVALQKRYSKITQDCSSNLLITDHFSGSVLDHLERGGNVLVMYRIAENRNRHKTKEEYYLPSTWERFKGIIWDRGHNCGGFLREHPIARWFPNDGFMDWQFYSLIEDSDKIDLDDFPVKIQPVIEGVDKAVRDRFDVGRFDLSEFQYAYTMRKFAYLFELKVGKGKLMVSGMNFKGIETGDPAACWMFEMILRYMASPEFKPDASISADQFRNYLLQKGKAKRIKERMMTQYWQLDDAPLESKRYWHESEAWLRQDD